MHYMVFMRHGAYDHELNKHGVGLNELGVAQIKKAIAYFKSLFGESKPAIISSDGPRSIRSAQLIAQAFRTKTTIQTGLRVTTRKEFNPDVLPTEDQSIVVTRGCFMLVVSSYLSEIFKCKNSMTTFEKGDTFALVCDFEKKTIFKVDF